MVIDEDHDGFPYFLNTISTLWVMVLRGNKLHGNIECSQTNGIEHMVQIVDRASNSFSGSLLAKCFKTWKAMVVDEDHDEFPYFLNTISTLHVMVLRENKLHGNIECS